MMHHNSRGRANLAMLEFIVRQLKTLKDELVFLGGCTIALLIDDPVAPDVRTTMDIDCIVDVLSFFLSCLPGHLSYGTATSARAHMVLQRIKKLAIVHRE